MDCHIPPLETEKEALADADQGSVPGAVGSGESGRQVPGLQGLMGVVSRDAGQNLFHSAKPPGTAVGLTTLEVSVPKPVGPTRSSSGPPLCPLGGCGLTQHSLGVSQPWALARHPKLEPPRNAERSSPTPDNGLGSVQSPRWSLSHPQGRVLPQT